MIAPKSVQALVAMLAERFQLDALWLFGSQANGRAHAQSDIDLAALFACRPSAAELVDAQLALASALGRDVDLVDLEEVSPILAMQVLRHGVLLWEHGSAHRIQFQAAVPGRYEDLRRVRRPIEVALRARLANG